MKKRTLDEQFKIQNNRHKTDHQDNFGVPVAFIHSSNKSFDENFSFFENAIRVYGGKVEKFENYEKDQAVVISYENGSKEVWVHPREDNYVKIYNSFIEKYEGVILDKNYREAGYAIDHSYNKASIKKNIDGHLRLFLVKSSVNSSWGGYFEKKLAKLFNNSDKSGIRKETVAIRAKITGIKAPRKGFLKSRNLKNVSNVVSKLIESKMIPADCYGTDFQTLAVFCGMADGKYVGMTVNVSTLGSVTVKPHSV